MATATTVTKPKTNLPYGDPNNPYGILPLNPPAPTSSGTGGNPNISFRQPELTTVQKQAQGQRTPLQVQTNQLAQKLVADPTQGMDPNYANVQEEALRSQNQKAYETARQGMAPAAGSAIDQRSLLSAAMSNVEGERKFRTDLDQQLSLMRQQAAQGALSSANATSGTEGNLQSQAIQNMLSEQAAINEQDPNAGFDFLQGGTGVGMQFRTGQEKARAALADEYDAQQFQYAQIHGQDPNLVDQTTHELTDLGVQQFNEYMAQNALGETGPTYQNLITGKADKSALRGGADPSSPNNAYYKDVASKAPEYSGFSKDSPPALSSIVKRGGNIYYVLDTSARNVQIHGGSAVGQYVLALDMNTGNQVKLYNDGKIA
jgi:hypothetical protein